MTAGGSLGDQSKCDNQSINQSINVVWDVVYNVSRNVKREMRVNRAIDFISFMKRFKLRVFERLGDFAFT